MHANIKKEVENELKMLEIAGYRYNIIAIDASERVKKLKDMAAMRVNEFFKRDFSWEYSQMEQRQDYEVAIQSPNGISVNFSYSADGVHVMFPNFTKSEKELFAAKFPEGIRLLSNALFMVLANDEINNTSPSLRA